MEQYPINLTTFDISDKNNQLAKGNSSLMQPKMIQSVFVLIVGILLCLRDIKKPRDYHKKKKNENNNSVLL